MRMLMVAIVPSMVMFWGGAEGHGFAHGRTLHTSSVFGVCVSVPQDETKSQDAPVEVRTPVMPPDMKLNVRSPQGYYIDTSKLYPSIGLWGPIREHEFEQYAALMNLSDLQKAEFERLYEQYRKEELKTHDAQVQPAWDAVVELYATGLIEQSIPETQAYTRLKRIEVVKAKRQLEQLESVLFYGLIPVLAEAQLPKLEMVHRLRIRERNQQSMFDRYPGANADFVRSLLIYEQRGLDCTPSDPALYHETLYAYDVTLTAHVVRRTVQSIRLIADSQVADATMYEYTMNETGTLDGYQRAKATSQRANRQLLNLDKAIAQHNKVYLDLLTDMLPPDTAWKLRYEFMCNTYPSVYPDYTDVRSVLHQALDLDSINAEQESQIREIHDWYAPTRDMINRRMEQRFLKWREYYGEMWSYTMEKRTQFEDDMLVLHAQRRDHALLAIDQLREILDEDQWQEIESDIERIKHVVMIPLEVKTF
jgi:hypothetical protein